jgi:peptide/nickel transport system substrate-binding protein
VVNKTLSVGRTPVFSDHNTVVTITLKHWVWSNGSPITARDIVFWMNMLSAVTDPNAPAVGSSNAPGPGSGAAVPGGFPENVVSYSQVGTYSVVFRLNASYNPTWYLYNELSQISTVPQGAWDKLSASGPVGNADASAEPRVALPGPALVSYVPADPGTATSGALGVAQFINVQSQDLATYDTNPLWKTVDGPLRLSQFTSSGYLKMVPNPEYSGSPKVTISAFEELPFTSDTAEFNALRSGSLTIGYIPSQDLSQKTSLERNEGYRFSVWNNFMSMYLPYNFTNPTAGPIFKQLYFRQAMQDLVDQSQYIKQFMLGIGRITNGPVPDYPPGNPDESPLELNGQLYPYNPSKAVALLKNNGWTVKPGGVSYCSKPGSGAGDCGSGVKQGQAATFQMLYQSGLQYVDNEMQALQSTLKQKAGIGLVLHQAPLADVLSISFGGCTPSTPCSDWEIADWTGWEYAPDYLPTGEETFYTGSDSNTGDYSSATNDANILATTVAPSKAAEKAALFKYQDYLAEQVPVMWLPYPAWQLTMYKSNLKGLLPQGIFTELYPQYYSLSK